MPAARDAARPRPGRIGGDRRAPDRHLPGAPRRAAGSSSAGPRCTLFDPWREEPSLIAPGRPRPLRRGVRSCPKRRARRGGAEPRRVGPRRDRARGGPAHDGAGCRTASASGGWAWAAPARSTAPALAAANRAVGNRADAGGARVHGRGAAPRVPGARALRGRGRRPRRRARARRPRRLAGAARRERSRAARQPAALHGPARRLPRLRRVSRAGSTCRSCSARARPISRRASAGSRAGRCAPATARACCRRRGGEGPCARGPAPQRGSVRVRVVPRPAGATTSTADTLARFLADAWRVGRDLRPHRAPPRGRAAAPPRRGRDPLRRHGPRLDPGPAGRPADRDARRRPDDRRLPEDRDGAHRGPAAPRAAACPAKAR